MSPESMKEIGDTIKMRDARFLEVQLIGTKEQAAKGTCQNSWINLADHGAWYRMETYQKFTETRMVRKFSWDPETDVPIILPGELLVLMSGNRTLSNDIMSCIESFGYVSYYYGDNDMATKMGIILRMGMAANLLALSEMMAVADRVGIRQRDLLSALGKSHLHTFHEITTIFLNA